MRRSILSAAVGLVGLGCGPRVRPAVDCEGDGPMRLLELEDTEPGVQRVERGWLIGADDWTWAVECDAAPRRAFDGWLRPPLAEGMPWLGTQSDLRLEWGTIYYAPIDPWAETAPERLGHSLLLGVVGDAMVFALPAESREHPDPRLLHVTFDAGSVRESTIVPVTLLQAPIEIGSPFGPHSTMIHWEWPNLQGDSALALVELPDDPAGEGTVEIDLATGRARLLRAGARVENDVDGRLAVLRVTDPELETSQSIILDRVTGVELPLGREPGWQVQPHKSSRVITASSDDETHVVLLPELRQLWLPGQLTTRDDLIADDGTLVLQGADGWYALRPGQSTPVLVYPELDFVAVMGNDLYVADRDTPFFPFDWAAYDPHEPQRLLRIPLDGPALPEPEVVLPGPVYEVVALADGKWAVFVSLEGEEWEELRGELRIFDPARGSSVLVAEDAMLLLEPLNRVPGGSSGYPLVLGGPRDELLYVRHGSRDEARAIWRIVP